MRFSWILFAPFWYSSPEHPSDDLAENFSGYTKKVDAPPIFTVWPFLGIFTIITFLQSSGMVSDVQISLKWDSKASAVTLKSAFRISASIPSIPTDLLFFISFRARTISILDGGSVLIRSGGFLLSSTSSVVSQGWFKTSSKCFLHILSCSYENDCTQIYTSLAFH